MSHWTIEGVAGKFTCFATTLARAGQRAKATKKPVLVRFHGHRVPPNRDAASTNFKLFPDGRRDCSIDPAWHTNHRRTR